MKNKLINPFILLLIVFTSFSCQTQQKFDRLKWAEVADLMTFPNRKVMIDDLVKNYHLKGKTLNQIEELLGQPQSKLDSTFKIFYDVDVNYGSDIDPIYSKTLLIEFDKDTIVKAFEVQEWKK